MTASASPTNTPHPPAPPLGPPPRPRADRGRQQAPGLNPGRRRRSLRRAAYLLAGLAVAVVLALTAAAWPSRGKAGTEEITATVTPSSLLIHVTERGEVES